MASPSAKFDEMVKAAQGQSVQDQFSSALKVVGPYTSGFSTPYTGSQIYTPNAPANLQQGSAFQQLIQKAVNVGSQTGKLAIGLGRTALNFVKNSAVDIYQAGFNTARTAIDSQTQGIQVATYAKMTRELENKQDAIMQLYKSGKMSREDYIKSLNDLNDGYNSLNKENSKIVNGPSPGQRVQDMIETAINILSLGSLGLTEVGGKQLIAAGSSEARQALISQGATNLEQLIMRVPAARTLITRNIEEMAAREGQKMAGESAWQFIKRNSEKIATGLLIKRPVFYQANIGQAESLYKNVLKGDYKGALTDAAWLGVQMLSGGPLGKAKDTVTYTSSGVKKLAHGKGSFIDELSTRFGSKKADQLAKYVVKSNDKNVEKALRVMQDVNMGITRGDVARAADNLMATYSHLDASEIAKLTPKRIVEDMMKWRDVDEIWNTAVKSGKLPISAIEAKRYTPVRWDASTRTTVANAVKKAGNDKNEMLKAVETVAEQPSSGFGNNKNLMQQIKKIIAESPDAKTAGDAIQEIDAALATTAKIPKFISKQIAAKGYVMAEPVGGRIQNFIETEDLTKLISGAIKKPETFDPSAAPAPVVSQIAGFFKKTGITPEESNQYASRELSRSVASSLDRTVAGKSLGISVDGADPANGGAVVLSRLQNYIEQKSGVATLDRISAGKSALVDVRQMTTNEIQDALQSVKNGKVFRIGRDEAKEIRKAIIKGYSDVPLELRGLGDKAVDTLYKYNPLYKTYARTQSALRYTYNPFFRVQESAETKILAHAKANNLIWMKTRAELDDAAKVLEKSRIFSGILPGEATNDITIGRITANLTKGQKRDLAGLALDIAESQGQTLEKLAAESPEILDDALRVIVQYPRKGTISSPLARTLNLVFFPVRYNAKVTMVAADVIAQQPPSMQKAILHSIFQFKNYLQSDEGIRWQADNADAISLFSWITPINSITSTLKILSGNVNSWGDLGQIGGLPFGIISQMLDSQGIIKLNKPYVNPATGDVFPSRIPQSAKARASVAVVDVLNTLFTYPGRTLGLPGKNQMLKNFVSSFIATNGKDFEQRLDMESLTPLQKRWVEVLKGDTSPEAIDALYQSPLPNGFQWYTLPPGDLPLQPDYKAEAAKNFKAPKKSKTLSKSIQKPGTAKRIIPGPNPLSIGRG